MLGEKINETVTKKILSTEYSTETVYTVLSKCMHKGTKSLEIRTNCRNNHHVNSAIN